MFDVKRPEMVNKTFRLPADLLKRLEVVAQEKNVSVNELVRQSCEYALAHLKTDDD